MENNLFLKILSDVFGDTFFLNPEKSARLAVFYLFLYFLLIVVLVPFFKSTSTKVVKFYITILCLKYGYIAGSLILPEFCTKSK